MKYVPTRTNDHLILKALSKLTGVHSNVSDIKDYFKICDSVAETTLALPFSYTDLVVVYERLPVLHEVFNPKLSSYLLDLLADAPGAPYLITDPGFQSIDSLFVVTQTEKEDSLYERWMSRMDDAKVIINSHPRYGTLFAAALTSFYNV